MCVILDTTIARPLQPDAVDHGASTAHGDGMFPFKPTTERSIELFLQPSSLEYAIVLLHPSTAATTLLRSHTSSDTTRSPVLIRRYPRTFRNRSNNRKMRGSCAQNHQDAPMQATVPLLHLASHRATAIARHRATANEREPTMRVAPFAPKPTTTTRPFHHRHHHQDRQNSGSTTQ